MNRGLLCLYLLPLSGCWSMKTPAMLRAVELERSGDPVEAERAWFNTLDDDLTQQEWSIARKRGCAIRMERLGPEVEALESIDYEQAQALHELLSPCPEGADIEARISMLEQASAVADLAEIRSAPVRVSEQLSQAMPLMSHLPEGHEGRAWFQEQVDSQRQIVLNIAAESMPVTQAMYSQIAARYGWDGPMSLEVAAAPQLAVTVHSVEWVADDSCKEMLPLESPEPGGGGGAPIRIQIEATGCTTEVSSRSELESYTATETRYELQEVERTETVLVQVDVPVVECINPYLGNGCESTGRTQSVPKAQTRTWTEIVEVPVDYEVERTRRVRRASRTVRANLGVRVSSPDGERSRELKVFRTNDNIASGMEPDPTVPELRAVGRDLAALWMGEISETAIEDARSWRVEALSTVDRAHAEQARESMLTALVGGATLSPPQLDFVAVVFGLTGEELRNFAELESFELPPPLPAEVKQSIHYSVPDETGVIRDGFPEFLLGFGYTHHGAEFLEAQPKRAASSGYLSARWAGSAMSEPSSRGVGLHLFAESTAQLGVRMSEAYRFPVGDGVESPLVLGIDLQGGLLVGLRGRRAALFGGIAPRQARLILGSQTSRGLAIPLAAYGELRLVDRYPILVTVWGFGLPITQSQARGVRLDLPVAPDWWLTPRAEEQTLRTNIRGLSPEDPVDAGYRTLQVISVGLSHAL